MRSETGRRWRRDDFRMCEEIARTHGKTFYFASRFLRPHQRRGVLAAYAFCRVADDMVDAVQVQGERATARALEAWKVQIEHPRHPVALAFHHTRERFGIPVEPVHDLMTGMLMDLSIRRYETWNDLRIYCYHVAGTVGLMVAPILGCRDANAQIHAIDLGIAMQLTNILRDVREDAEMDRLYLPLDDVATFGCDPDAILAGHPGNGFRDLMAFQIARARQLYVEAGQGIPALDLFGRLTTLTASDLYSRILDRIEEQDYDVFRARAHCTPVHKLMAVPGIVSTFCQVSLASPATVPTAAPRPLDAYRTERQFHG